MQRWAHRYIDTQTNQTLDCWFPRANKPLARGCAAQQAGIIKSDFIEITIDDLNLPPITIEDVYLRLHLLSECFCQPNQVNLEGIFGLLTNVAWTSGGPVLPERVDELRAHLAAAEQQLNILSVDKFPRMIDYVVPMNVRIADPDRVRLGAHLAEGTTVMHEGFVNFNAGSIGAAMIEGRVTPGVIVGEGSDVGAGSSIMGTLSGGGKTINSIGKNSLLGANGGIGISLGDNCVVEAGLYVTAGTIVRNPAGEFVKAATLSGISALLFRRNSKDGCVEALSSQGVNWGGLNATLHTTD